MTQHNKDILNALAEFKAQIKIDQMINAELGTKIPLEVHSRLYNLYNFLDVEDLLVGVK